MPIEIFPAHSYADVLPFYGFKKVETTEFEKGDIVVFHATKNHKWGYIAMWNGEQWISDATIAVKYLELTIKTIIFALQ